MPTTPKPPKPKLTAEERAARAAAREQRKTRKGLSAGKRDAKKTFKGKRTGARLTGGRPPGMSDEAYKISTQAERVAERFAETGRIVIKGRFYQVDKADLDSYKRLKDEERSAMWRDDKNPQRDEYLKKRWEDKQAKQLAEMEAKIKAKSKTLTKAQNAAVKKAVKANTPKAPRTPKATKPAGPTGPAASAKPKASGPTGPTGPAETKPAPRKRVAKPVAETKPATTKPAAKKTAPAAKKTAAPKAGRTVVANASGNATVDKLSAQIKKIDEQMKANAKAVRAGTMTPEQQVAERNKLTAKKNTLQTERAKVAKAAGVEVPKEAPKPPRAPKAEAPAKPVKSAAPKANKPAAKKTVAPKVTKPAPAAVEAPAKKAAAPKKAAAKKTAAPAKKAAKPRVAKPQAAAAKAEKVVEAASKANNISKASGMKIVGRVLGKAFWVYTAAEIASAIAETVSANAPKGMSASSSAASGGMGLPTNMKFGNLGKSKAKPEGKSKPSPSARPARHATPFSYYENPRQRMSPGAGVAGSRPSGSKPSGSGYRVKAGDTLWDIAQKNNTTVAAIYAANPELKKRKDAGKNVIFRNTLVRIPKK